MTGRWTYATEPQTAWENWIWIFIHPKLNVEELFWLKVSRTCRSQDPPILTCNIHMLKTLWSFEAKPVKAPRRAKPSQMTSRRSISVPWRVKRAFNGGFTGTWRIRFVLKRCPESWIFKHNLFCSLDIQKFFFSKLSTLPTCWKTFKFRQSS